jgi:hypothetical protein
MSAEIIPLRQRAAEPSLAPMLALTATGMNAVNAVILDRMQSEVPLIPALAGHLIAGGGKRLRPMLTVAGAELCGYHGSRHHKLAAAVEFIHTATLLHDDVVDGSELRRGKATANIVFGNPATVLVGDFLFTRSFELMVEDGSLKVLKILSKASSVIAEGEVDQLTAQRHIETSEERYLSIIGAKTAALFAAATRIAAVVAEKGEAEERALESYGRNLAGDPRLCPGQRRRARLLARCRGGFLQFRRGPRTRHRPDREARYRLGHPRPRPALCPARDRRDCRIPGRCCARCHGRGCRVRRSSSFLSARILGTH